MVWKERLTAELAFIRAAQLSEEGKVGIGHTFTGAYAIDISRDICIFASCR